MFQKSTHVHFQKILKKNSWKTYGIFLGGKHHKNGEKRKALSLLLLLEMGEI